MVAWSMSGGVSEHRRNVHHKDYGIQGGVPADGYLAFAPNSLEVQKSCGATSNFLGVPSLFSASL
jgi:hypothetical protein